MVLEARKSTPLELGFGWMVDGAGASGDRGNFIGRDAILAEQKRGPAWHLVGLEVSWEALEALYESFNLPPSLPATARRDGLPVYAEDGRQIGKATSHTWSPILKKYLVIASVHRGYEAKGTQLAARAHRRVRAPQGRRDRGARHRSTIPKGSASREPCRATQTYDAIVVGAGHNGLICAAYLAKAGRKVLVVERRHQVGGATTTEEIYPGFKYTCCSYVVSLLRPWIIRDLDLPRYGYEILPLDSTFTPFPDGRYLMRDSDPERNRRSIADFSQRDAEVYKRFGQKMAELGRLVKPVIDDVGARSDVAQAARARSKLARLAKGIRGQGDKWLVGNVKMMTMSAVDFLSEWFESEQLIAPMSVSGIIGTFLGVRSPGTAYVLLHHYMGEIDGSYRAWGLPKGGTGAIADAIAASARDLGVEIRLEAPVDHLLLEKGVGEGRRARERRRDPRQGGDLRRRSAPHLPRSWSASRTSIRRSPCR